MKEPKHTVGALLAAKREASGLEIADVTRTSGLSERFILDIESHNYRRLPNDVYTAGRVKKYAETVGLDGDEFRRKYLEERGAIPANHSLRRKHRYKSPIVTSSLAPKVLLITSAIAIVIYIAYQVVLATSSPRLEVVFPQENQVIYTESVELVGTTHPDSSVTIDGHEVMVSDDGSFRYPLLLPEGRRTVRVEASNDLGRTSSVTRSFIISSP